MNPELDELRRAIEAADDALIDALSARAHLVRTIWAKKTVLGLPRKDADREDAERGRLLDRAAARGLDEQRVGDVLTLVIGHDLLASPDRR